MPRIADMLRQLILRQLDAEERKLGGVSMNYLRHVARGSSPPRSAL
ncbi:MAG TPA: hypothetical protein VEX70_13505 [Pyrinomonadaceae bacterium]|nr:hypothetical protein [Pyrinomonadaceae bacterium]